MSRSSLNCIFKKDFEATMACLELRIGTIFTILIFFNPELSFEYVFTLRSEFLSF